MVAVIRRRNSSIMKYLVTKMRPIIVDLLVTSPTGSATVLCMEQTVSAVLSVIARYRMRTAHLLPGTSFQLGLPTYRT